VKSTTSQGYNEYENIEVVRKVLQVMGKDKSLIEFVEDRPGHDLRYSLGEHQAETAEGARSVELVANAIIKIEDRIAQSPIIKRPKGTTPLIGAVALEQMGYKVDPTGRFIKGLPLMI